MAPLHIQSTSRALYRVFVAPNLHATRIPFLYYPTRSIKVAGRGKKKVKKDIKRHALSDDYTLDAAIQSPWINLAHPDGRFETTVSLQKTLSSFDRKTHHLVQVSPGKGDEVGISDPAYLPTCRVLSKIDLREKQEHKLSALRKQAKGMAVKIVELNWAIARGDLDHRMKQMRGFLTDGKKVEVMFGPKKGGRKASKEEAGAVLKAVRGAVEECKGSKELRVEGEVGEIMKFVVQGKEAEKVKKVDGEGEGERVEENDLKVEEEKVEENDGEVELEGEVR